MKVCYITPVYPDLASRPRGVFVKEVVQGVVQRGNDAVVVVPRVYQDAEKFEEIEYANGCRERIHRFDFGSQQRPLATYDHIPVRLMLKYFRAGLRCVLQVLKQERPDVAHVHFAVPTGPIAALACRLAKVPWVLSVYGTELTWSSSPLARIPGRFAVRRAPVVIGCSEFACETAIEFGARPEICHRTFIGGVDTTRFCPEASSEGIRESYGIPSDAKLLLFIGNLIPRKRVGDLIRAMPGVLSRFPNTFLFVAGDGPLREELRELGESLGVADRVLSPGALPNNDLPGLLSASDVFALPSEEEGMGMVLLEAMAAGKPVVASRNSGILSVVDDGENGLLFETGNVEALTLAVTNVLSNEELSRSLGQSARKKAVEEFDREKQVNTLLRLYEEVLRGR